MRVAKKADRRMPPEFRCLLYVGIGAFAPGVVATLAEEALPTGNRERDDDTVPCLELADAAADLDNLSHRLMAEHVTVLHAGNDAIVNVEIGAADRTTGDTDDGITSVFDC